MSKFLKLEILLNLQWGSNYFLILYVTIKLINWSVLALKLWYSTISLGLPWNSYVSWSWHKTQQGTLEYLKPCQEHECEICNDVFCLPGGVGLDPVLPQSPGVFQPEWSLLYYSFFWAVSVSWSTQLNIGNGRGFKDKILFVVSQTSGLGS